MRTILSILLLGLFFACTNQSPENPDDFTLINGEKIPVLHLDQIPDSATTVGLSALFEDVLIIPLETSEKCLIRNWDTYLTDESLFLATQTGRLGPVHLMEFDLKGNYLRDFG